MGTDNDYYPSLGSFFEGTDIVRNRDWEIQVIDRDDEQNRRERPPRETANSYDVYIRFRNYRTRFRNYRTRISYSNILFQISHFRQIAGDMIFVLAKKRDGCASFILTRCELYRVLKAAFPEKFEKKENPHG